MKRTVLAIALLVATARAANQYEIAALAEAKKQNLTAAQVRAKTYPQVAALAGVTLGPKGQSPKDFFYVHVRRHVASSLAADESVADAAAKKAALEAALAASVNLKDYEVVPEPDGSFKIRKKVAKETPK